MVSSYLIAMALGTLLLEMPWATRSRTISWVDALFTTTSALCVTGLTVVDTGTFFTTAGQVAILCLIQIGGLGIMTFAVFILVSAGWRLSTQQRFCIQESFSTEASDDLRRLVLFVLGFTAVAELAGSAVLAFCWKDLDLGQRVYFGLFHAVSAFCNAGFGLYPDSLARYYDHGLLNVTVGGLIILGGLGFPVLFEVTSWLRERKQPRFSLHTRLALLSTAILIGVGLVAFWALERRNCLAGMPLSVQLLVSFFQSVTPRTAGFATVDFARLSNATLMVIVILMFIGASPGSTGGGVKTTSFAVLVGLLWNRVKGSSYNNMMNCTVPEATVGRAVTVFILSVNAVVIVLCLLLVTQSEAVPCEQSRGLFLEYLFETVSAFGTVGLSMGKTAQLNAAGKLILTAMMFTGRVGILTLAYLFSSRERRAVYRYAEETVMIG
jgi:trk system potassium uptake protein TrkH